MNRIKKLAALLLILCLLAGLTACAMDEQDAITMLEAIQIAAENIEEAAETAPADELILVEETQSPAETKAPEEAETPSETEAPVETEAPSETEVPSETEAPEETEAPAEEVLLDPDGEYTSREDVALYLHTYGELPKNFMTKSEARALGWSGGGLDDYAYGMCIGGDRFGNYEGLLPDGSYHECDIDTLHAKSRGAQRLIYSDDGRIYYTDDHYESFTLLYGEE